MANRKEYPHLVTVFLAKFLPNNEDHYTYLKNWLDDTIGSNNWTTELMFFAPSGFELRLATRTVEQAIMVKLSSPV